jgi:hypothetical protein
MAETNQDLTRACCFPLNPSFSAILSAVSLLKPSMMSTGSYIKINQNIIDVSEKYSAVLLFLLNSKATQTQPDIVMVIC